MTPSVPLLLTGSAGAKYLFEISMPMMLTTLPMDPPSGVPNAPRVRSPHPAHVGARCRGASTPSGIAGDCHRPAVCISTIEAAAAVSRLETLLEHLMKIAHSYVEDIGRVKSLVTEKAVEESG